jgi:hypothetical protein
MALGVPTYGASLLASLGVAVVPDDAGPYPEVSLDALAATGVDLVLVPSEPYSFTDAHLAELRPVAPTVRVDVQDLFWWGARTVAAVERLRASIAAARRPGP